MKFHNFFRLKKTGQFQKNAKNRENKRKLKIERDIMEKQTGYSDCNFEDECYDIEQG